MMNPWRKYGNKNHNVAGDLHSSSVKRQLLEALGGRVGEDLDFSFLSVKYSSTIFQAISVL